VDESECFECAKKQRNYETETCEFVLFFRSTAEANCANNAIFYNANEKDKLSYVTQLNNYNDGVLNISILYATKLSWLKYTKLNIIYGIPCTRHRQVKEPVKAEAI